MPIHSLNLNPRSARVAQKSKLDFVLVDVGARGGVRAEWACLGPIATFVGFDPDEAECARLTAGQPNLRIYPVALGASVGKKNFYLTMSPMCHGFRPINDAYKRRFPNYWNNKVAGKIKLACTTLDEWSKRHSLGHADFLKLDAEGTEADILSGAAKFLKSEKCLGVFTEVWFEPDVKRGSNYGFAAIDTILRKHGLRLFDVVVQRYPRSTLPVGRLNFSSGPDGRFVVHAAPHLYSTWGQVLTSDLLYFRDPIAEIAADAKARKFWDRDTVLRLIVLLDLYNYQDVAIEILSYFRRLFKEDEAKELLASLLPCDLIDRPGAIVNIDYDQYFDISLNLFKGMNIPNFDTSAIEKAKI